MKTMNIKRILVLMLALVMIMATTCTIAFASGADANNGSPDTQQSEGDLFDKGEALLDQIQSKVLGISSALAGVFLVIAACMWGFGNKQQSQSGWEWMKRIVIAYIAINLITTILATIDNVAGIIH